MTRIQPSMTLALEKVDLKLWCSEKSESIFIEMLGKAFFRVWLLKVTLRDI
jgi:hypothetical protein